MNSLWVELRRRKVVRVAFVYAVGAWVLLQVGDTVLGLGGFPSWTGQVLLGVVVLGLPIAIALSWAFDITPQGIVATEPQGRSDTTFRYSEPAAIDVSTLDLSRPPVTPLVGRAREREIISNKLELAASGNGGILFIGGEPGVGKTRLGEEAIGQGIGRGMLPLVGHAYDEKVTPFVTSTEILEEVSRILPDDVLRNALGNTAPEVALLLPDLRRTFPAIPEPTKLPPDQQQRFLFNAVVEFLTRLGKSCPLVILLDDLHWADESSILLLEHIAPRLPKLPILMVATYREVDSEMGEPFKRALAQLSRQAYVTRMSVKPLARDDVAALLNTLGGPGTPEQVVDVIFEETDGNAFFVQSVYEHLAEEEKLFDSSGQWLADIDTETLAVPDSVRLVTGRRLGKLSETTRGVLAVAAVMGLRFRLPVLEAAAADRDSVVDAIDAAHAANLIKQSAGGRELRYEFVHALARQAILAELSAARQQRLHLKIAEAIEQVDARDLERRAADLAFHLVAAGTAADADKVVHWSHIAGVNAMATAAFEEAVHNFDTAIAVAGDSNPEQRADLLHLRGSAQLILGRKEGFLDDLHEALALYEKEQLGEKAAQVAADIAYTYVWNAQSDKAFDVVTRALKLLGGEETPGRCMLLSAQGLAQTIGRQPGNAERSHDAAVLLARQLALPNLLADVLQNQAFANWQRLAGTIQSEPAHEAANYRRDNKQEWNLGHCLWMEKAGLVFAGRFDEAARIDDELTPIIERNEDFGSLACSALMSGTIQLAHGNLEESSREMQRGTEFFGAGGFPWGVYSEGHYSVNALMSGDYDSARKAFEFAGANTIPGISWSGCETCYWLSGKATLGDTNILECYRSLEDGIPEAGEALSCGAVMLLEGSIEALVLAGHDAEAAALYPVIREFVSSGLGVVAFSYGLHERFAGMAAAAARDWDSAERHFENTLTLAEDLPHRIDQARVRYWYARMLLARDALRDRERAEQLLAEANTLSEEMGLKGLLKMIREQRP